MTLGQTIGIVKHTFSNSNDNKEKCQLTVNINFASVSDNDIKGWLCSNRVIAFARPLSKLTLNEMKELDGTTLDANTIGQKVKSRSEQIAALVAIGIPETLAIVALDDPAKMSKLEAMLNEIDEDKDE